MVGIASSVYLRATVYPQAIRACTRGFWTVKAMKGKKACIIGLVELLQPTVHVSSITAY